MVFICICTCVRCAWMYSLSRLFFYELHVNSKQNAHFYHLFLDSSILFQNKRSKLHKQLMSSELTWKKLVKFVEDSLDKKEQQSVSGDLRTILQAAKQIGKS